MRRFCLMNFLHPFPSVSSGHHHEEGVQELHYSGPAAVWPHVVAHSNAGDLPDLRGAPAPQHPHPIQVWGHSSTSNEITALFYWADKELLGCLERNISYMHWTNIPLMCWSTAHVGLCFPFIHTVLEKHFTTVLDKIHSPDSFISQPSHPAASLLYLVFICPLSLFVSFF